MNPGNKMYLFYSCHLFMQLLQALNAENEDARASSSEEREEPKVGKMICYCHGHDCTGTERG